MDDNQKKTFSRQELLKKLHNKVNNKQTGRLNKTCKNQQLEKLKEKMTNGDVNMKEIVENVIKKIKKKNKKTKVPQTLEQKITDLQKEFIPTSENKNI
jgi:signal recognition particle GTPase